MSLVDQNLTSVYYLDVVATRSRQPAVGAPVAQRCCRRVRSIAAVVSTRIVTGAPPKYPSIVSLNCGNPDVLESSANRQQILAEATYPRLPDRCPRSANGGQWRYCRLSLACSAPPAFHSAVRGGECE